MTIASPQQAPHAFLPLESPLPPWLALAVRVWTQGIVPTQTPYYLRQKSQVSPLPELPKLDRSVTGAAKAQLEISLALLEQERARGSAGDPWEVSYRRDFQPGWWPLCFPREIVDGQVKAQLPGAEPDSLAVLCPTSRFGDLLAQASTLLLLRPGRAEFRDGAVRVVIPEGPCLAICQGHLMVDACLPLAAPDCLQAPRSLNRPSDLLVHRVAAASDSTRYATGQPYLLPVVEGSQAAWERY